MKKHLLLTAFFALMSLATINLMASDPIVAPEDLSVKFVPVLGQEGFLEQITFEMDTGYVGFTANIDRKSKTDTPSSKYTISKDLVTTNQNDPSRTDLTITVKGIDITSRSSNQQEKKHAFIEKTFTEENLSYPLIASPPQLFNALKRSVGEIILANFLNYSAFVITGKLTIAKDSYPVCIMFLPFCPDSARFDIWLFGIRDQKDTKGNILMNNHARYYFDTSEGNPGFILGDTSKKEFTPKWQIIGVGNLDKASHYNLSRKTKNNVFQISKYRYGSNEGVPL